MHLGAIVATLWVLLLNGVVGYQLLDDGTPLSIGTILFSAVALFVGTGYIALDTAFSYTHHFDPSLQDPNRNIGLYVLYQLVPLVFLFFFFILESILVLRVLGERKPMRKSSSPNIFSQNLHICSIPICRGALICHWPNLPIRYQYASLPGNEGKNRRRSF